MYGLEKIKDVLVAVQRDISRRVDNIYLNFDDLYGESSATCALPNGPVKAVGYFQGKWVSVKDFTDVEGKNYDPWVLDYHLAYFGNMFWDELPGIFRKIENCVKGRVEDVRVKYSDGREEDGDVWVECCKDYCTVCVGTEDCNECIRYDIDYDVTEVSFMDIERMLAGWGRVVDGVFAGSIGVGGRESNQRGVFYRNSRPFVDRVTLELAKDVAEGVGKRLVVSSEWDLLDDNSSRCYIEKECGEIVYIVKDKEEGYF